jgi:hypothetical protein
MSAIVPELTERLHVHMSNSNHAHELDDLIEMMPRSCKSEVPTGREGTGNRDYGYRSSRLWVPIVAIKGTDRRD